MHGISESMQEARVLGALVLESVHDGLVQFPLCGRAQCQCDGCQSIHLLVFLQNLFVLCAPGVILLHPADTTRAYKKIHEHRARVMGVSAYICSIFFRICLSVRSWSGTASPCKHCKRISSSLCAAGHNASLTAVRAYICLVFFTFCLFCALLG